jgi:hypothetical protein
MKLRYIILVVSAPLILACSVAGAMTNSTPPAVATMPVIATQTPYNPPAITLTGETKVVTKKHLDILGDGCWYIRSTPNFLSDGSNIIRSQCGGTVEYIGWAANGYLELANGEYICNRAVGGADVCQ